MSHPDKYANLKAEIQAIFEEYEGRYGYSRIRDERGSWLKGVS